jgi:hypothetical protein
MKKYIYSPQHQGLVLAPLMTEPDKDNGIFWDEYKPETGEWDFNKDMFNAHMGHYNSWLSSPPIYKVREEDIKDFLEPIDESRFEVRVMAEKCSSDSYWYKNRLGELFEFEEWNNGYKVAHGMPDVGTGYAYIQYEDGVLVAIPKKGNESKEQSPSVEQVLNDTTIYGRPLSDFLLPDQIERLAEYLQKALFL